MVKELDYLYLTSLIRAREPKSFSGAVRARILEAPGFDEAARQLQELGYPDLSGMDAGQISKALEQYRAEKLEELEGLSPEAELIQVFRLRFDYHNAKTLIKSEAASTDGARLLLGAGRFAPDKLQKDFENDALGSYPEIFAAALIEAKSTLGRTENPQLADFVLDAAYFSELEGLAQSISSPLVREYVRRLTDSANLSAAVRTLRMGRDAGFLKQALFSGGSVDFGEFLREALTAEELEKLFSDTIFAKAAELGAKSAAGGSLSEFERERDGALRRWLDGLGRVTYGAEAPLQYLANFESELADVRVFLTGLLSGVSREQLRKKLGDANA
ncbi:MAG: V-type ATPase subunit [Oscillospiraceae bacterium]|nr:V-type ATPase subunit [Oscillospiraceae bacterium]